MLAAPLPLTPVVNLLQRAAVDGRYAISRHLAAGVVYWFDQYKVDDLALGPVASLAQPATAAPSLMLFGVLLSPIHGQQRHPSAHLPLVRFMT